MGNLTKISNQIEINTINYKVIFLKDLRFPQQYIGMQKCSVKYPTRTQ